MKNFRFLLALAAVLIVASAHAQIVVKAGNDGKVYEPQPLGLGVATVTSLNGLTITSSTGTLTIANSGGIVTSGGYVGTFTFSGTTGVTFPTTGTLATLAGTETLSGKTLTAPTLNTPAIKDLTEVVAATNVITAAETGSTFFLNSETEFVSTLPAPAAGLHFTFIVTAAPASASYTIVTNASTNIIKGVQITAEDAAGSGDSGTADDTITLVDGQAVAGDRVEVWSDGTNWFAQLTTKVLAGGTFTQAN